VGSRDEKLMCEDITHGIVKRNSKQNVGTEHMKECREE
jgi:hypothetical protein